LTQTVLNGLLRDGSPHTHAHPSKPARRRTSGAVRAAQLDGALSIFRVITAVDSRPPLCPARSKSKLTGTWQAPTTSWAYCGAIFRQISEGLAR